MGANTPFQWDSERLIGTVQESEKVEHEVKLCMLNETAYIAVTKRVLKKDGWSIAKNQVFKREVFNHVAHLVANSSLYE